MRIFQLPPEPRHGCETLPLYTQFPLTFAHLIGASSLSSQHRNFFDHCLAPYKYSCLLTYLLISFLLINIYGISMKNTCELKFLLAGPECYKDTDMEAYDITRLTAELKSSDNVRHRNKIYFTLFWWTWMSKAHTWGRSNLPYEDCWA